MAGDVCKSMVCDGACGRPTRTHAERVTQDFRTVKINGVPLEIDVSQDVAYIIDEIVFHITEHPLPSERTCDLDRIHDKADRIAMRLIGGK